MNDKILDRYTSRESGGSDGGAPTDETEIFDLGTFGFLRGSRERAVMLELRKKNGNILAIGYPWIEKVSFDPSEGITLHLPGQQVKIRGRNLNAEAIPKVKLFEAITRHRVPWIQEASERESISAPKGTPVVDKIEW